MKKLVVALSALAVCTGAVGLSPAHADGEKVTVPAAGPAKTTTKFSGTFAVGMQNWTTTDCQSALGGTFTKHTFNVSVAKGAYSLVKAKMTVDVMSSPFLNGDVIELLDPAGNSMGTDQQKSDMSVEVINPVPGTWSLLTCEFLPDNQGDHSYDATVTVKTTCKAVSPCPVKKRK